MPENAVVRDCTICDDAGGCGPFRPVFPLSMSDFKPGDKEPCVQRRMKGWKASFCGDACRCCAALA